MGQVGHLRAIDLLVVPEHHRQTSQDFAEALIRQGLIREPLTVKELFAITDIHVHDGSGISVGNLRDLAPDYELLGLRSYGFFGQLPYGLPEKYRTSEHELIAAGALNGVHVGAIWMVSR